MPIIYTEPLTNLADRNASSRGTGNTGSLNNLWDGNPFTFYDTKSATLEFNATSMAGETVDTVYVVAENIDDVSFRSINPATQIFSDQPVIDTWDTDDTPGYSIRKAFITTHTSTITSTSMRVTLTRTAGTNSVRIFHLFIMRQLLDLKKSSTLTITRFQKSGQMRNAFPVPDLYGGTVLQTDANSWIHPQLSYQLWQTGSNLTEARNIVTSQRNIARRYPNITIWDLAEPNAQDYESIYKAYWTPASFTQELAGTNVVRHGFDISG